MALVFDAGSADAEAYISVIDADAYFAARGNASWGALTTEAKEQALRKGADYLEASYRWRGERASTTQALSWPRSGVTLDGVTVASDAVPLPIQRANAELAVRAAADDLVADEGAQVLSERVGPVAVTYAPGARQGTRYAAVESMLAPYLRGAGAVPVVRA